jgi:hypothetical protein
MGVPRAHNYDYALQKYLLLQKQHEELCSHLDNIRPRLSSTSSASSSSSPAASPTRSSPLTMSLSSSSLSSTSSSSSFDFTSPQLAVASRRHSRSGERRHSGSSRNHRRSSCRLDEPDPNGSGALATIVDEDLLYEISAEERRLCDVNESIKRALTEMLNCAAVRADPPFRTWVQGRLMEVEKELRSGRRRKGSLE